MADQLCLGERDVVDLVMLAGTSFGSAVFAVMARMHRATVRFSCDLPGVRYAV